MLTQRLRPTGIATQVAAFITGLALAAFVVSESWVEFDSIIPMWIAATMCVVAAALLSAWRPRQFVGLSSGVIASAVICTGFFTLLSSGPAIN